jgi:DUF971 family protein
MMALKPMPVPREVEITPVGTIRIVWGDGHVSTHLARDLRAKCPCAGCVDEWSGEVKVKTEDLPSNLTAGKVTRVGNYALTITWSDGHSTGIYAFDRLREMCPCPGCARR